MGGLENGGVSWKNWLAGNRGREKMREGGEVVEEGWGLEGR